MFGSRSGKTTLITGLAASIAAGAILIIDFFHTEELMQEDSFMLLSMFLIIGNIIIISIKSLNKTLIHLPVHISLIGLNVYSTVILSILWFGFGFTGKSMSFNLIAAFVINTVMSFYLWKQSITWNKKG